MPWPSGDGTAEYQLALFNALPRGDRRARSSRRSTPTSAGSTIPVTVAGASIGAFNALAITCRYPELVRSAVCMSGTYAIEQFLGGLVNDDLYFSSPLRFLPDLEGPALDTPAHPDDRARRRAAAAGRTSASPGPSPTCSGRKGIPNRVDDWGTAYDHDWPTWWAMLPLYLDDLLP